jgi:hypothetical protein
VKFIANDGIVIKAIPEIKQKVYMTSVDSNRYKKARALKSTSRCPAKEFCSDR